MKPLEQIIGYIKNYIKEKKENKTYGYYLTMEKDRTSGIPYLKRTDVHIYGRINEVKW